MRDVVVERAAEVLCSAIGLRAEGVSRTRLGRALTDLAGADAASWVASLAERPADLQSLIDHVTVQETGFFREPQHFEALARELQRRPGPGTIWSAGCANGQEVWSLAMLLAELGRRDWRIVGSDVSLAALARAREGLYGEREASRVSPARRRAFLQEQPDGSLRIRPELRERVSFTRHNLISSAVPPEALGAQVIFCRNVLIYLDRANVHRLLATLRQAMDSQGVLFIGASEVMPSDQSCFEAERQAQAFLFRPAGSRTPAAAMIEDPPRAPDPPRKRNRGPADVRAEARGAVLAGESLTAAGLHAEAATEFRRAVYLQPEDPVAHVRLGLALEQAGDPRAAGRAFRAARTALLRGGGASADDLGGFSATELERLIEQRLGDRD